MSGTYKIDGALFPKNPISKSWSRQPIARSGVGETIYTPFWQVEMTFSFLEVTGEVDWFQGFWLSGGLHTAVLPHPKTGQLTGFTGVNIADFSFSFSDIDSDSWTETNAVLRLDHISLSATGSV